MKPRTFAFAMGNCVSCKERASDIESPIEPSDPLPPAEGTEAKDTVVAVPVTKSCEHRHSLTVMDNLSNGNVKVPSAVESTAGLHRDRSLRVFRLQPTRSETKQKEVSEAKIQALFDNYKDSNEPDYILAEGIETFLNHLNLSPDEFKVLVLAWKLNAEHMCQFSRPEFTCGLKRLKADSISVLNNRLNEVTQDVVNDPDLFKELYRYTFRFGLDKLSGQRVLPTEMARCLWQIVFSVRHSALLDRWLEFLTKYPGGGVPRDTWDMFLHLTDQVGADLSLYDDSHAWPSVFDDFVEFENDRTNQNVAKCKDQSVIEECT